MELCYQFPRNYQLDTALISSATEVYLTYVHCKSCKWLDNMCELFKCPILQTCKTCWFCQRRYSNALSDFQIFLLLLIIEKFKVHFPLNLSNPLHGMKCISYQISCFEMFNMNFALKQICISPKTSLVHCMVWNAFPLKHFKSMHMSWTLKYHQMKICCFISFEMHFKLNSDKLHELASNTIDLRFVF